VKVLLMLAGQPLMRTHDLDVLCDQAARHFPALSAELDAVRPITPWAMVTRYPDLGGIAEPSAAEIAMAFAACSRLHRSVLDLCAG
jgi:hypothetical protein